ncbi:MAG TPA: carbohydrate ABC transporter permease [Clostridium sp.]
MKVNAKKKDKDKVFHIIIHIIFIFCSLLCIIPIILVVAISLMHEKDILLNGYTLIPKNATLNAYVSIFSNAKQLIYSYGTTIGITLVGTITGIWLTATIGYVITRRDYALRKQLSFYVFFTMLFSGGLIPSYILISKWLNMKDTYFALFVPSLVSAYNILLMKGFLQNLPTSIIDAAKIDGASELRTFISIIIPISKPAIATVGLFMAFAYWNDWMASFLYIDSDNKIMLQYLLIKVMKNLQFLNSADALNYGIAPQDVPTYSARMAMCVIASGPILLVFPFFQKYFVKGLTLGSVKG